MRKCGVALACALCALTLATAAAADLRVGVNDDGGKFEPGGSWFYPTMARMTSRPYEGREGWGRPIP